jgi:hypothetical protein
VAFLVFLLLHIFVAFKVHVELSLLLVGQLRALICPVVCRATVVAV